MPQMLYGKKIKVSATCKKCGLKGNATIAEIGGAIVNFRQSMAMACQEGICLSNEHDWTLTKQ